MKFWTYNRQSGLHVRPDTQPVEVYYIRRGNGLERVLTLSDDVLVIDPRNGGAISRREFNKLGAAPVVPPTINWQSPPTIPGGSGDYLIPAGNYLNEDPTKNLFNTKNQSSATGRVIAENSRLKSAGPIFGGFRGAIRAVNNIMEVIPPTTVGANMPRLVNGEEIYDLYFANNTVNYTGRGIYLTGVGNPKQFAGSVGSGQGVVLLRNRFRNVDGRIYGRKSNWTPTKPNSQFTASGAEYGALVANLIQFNGMPQCYILMQWNELLNDLGCWGEDMISMFGGSGGAAGMVALFEDNLLQNTGGFDWNYVPGVSASYDAGEQITLNADPGNTSAHVAHTGYSGTSHLIGDGLRSDTYANNSAYVTMRRTVALGFRPVLSIQAGHHNVMDSNMLYATDRHYAGVLYSGNTFQQYQVTDYHVGATAVDNGQIIFGYNEMRDNVRYVGSTSGAMPTIGDVTDNNGVFTGNTVQPGVTDGGYAAIQAFRARATAAGVTLGSTLN